MNNRIYAGLGILSVETIYAFVTKKTTWPDKLWFKPYLSILWSHTILLHFNQPIIEFQIALFDTFIQSQNDLICETSGFCIVQQYVYVNP